MVGHLAPRHRTLLAASIVVAAVLSPGPAGAAAEGSRSLASVEEVVVGEAFPAWTFVNLNSGPGGAPKIDLASTIGKRPVVFAYWIPGNQRSEEILVELQSIADEVGPMRLVLYGVATPPPGSSDASKIRDRVRELKLHVPVLQDDGFRLGQQLSVKKVPHISALDSKGHLRMVGAASLKQTLEYKMTLSDAIARLAETGSIGSYGRLPEYFPAVEMVGEACPEFEAPAISDGKVQRWSGLFDASSLNVLIFWSVDCQHCRKSLPEINDWLRKNGDGINVVSAARVTSEADEKKTREFCAEQGFVFRTVADRGGNLGAQFQVTSTPTAFIVGPGGVIDSVLLSGAVDFGKTFARKRLELLGGPQS